VWVEANERRRSATRTRIDRGLAPTIFFLMLRDVDLRGRIDVRKGSDERE
jgi:hypothetical protein